MSQEDAAEAAPGSPAAAEVPLRQSTDTIAKAGGDGGGAPQGDAATNAEAAEPPDADAVATAPTRHEVLVEGFTVPQVRQMQNHRPLHTNTESSRRGGTTTDRNNCSAGHSIRFC